MILYSGVILLVTILWQSLSRFDACVSGPPTGAYGAAPGYPSYSYQAQPSSYAAQPSSYAAQPPAYPAPPAYQPTAQPVYFPATPAPYYPPVTQPIPPPATPAPYYPPVTHPIPPPVTVGPQTPYAPSYGVGSYGGASYVLNQPSYVTQPSTAILGGCTCDTNTYTLCVNTWCPQTASAGQLPYGITSANCVDVCRQKFQACCSTSYNTFGKKKK